MEDSQHTPQSPTHTNPDHHSDLNEPIEASQEHMVPDSDRNASLQSHEQIDQENAESSERLPLQSSQAQQETESPMQSPTEENNEEDARSPMEKLFHKIKRDVRNQINHVRVSKELQELCVDPIGNQIADDYVEYLKTNEHDEEIFKSLCEEFNNVGALHFVSGFSTFEQEQNGSEALYEEGLDLGYILMETPRDRQVLLDPEVNHIAVGVSVVKNKLQIITLLSQKSLCVTQIKQAEGGIEVAGHMLIPTHGIYAVRVYRNESKKELALVGPERISMNQVTKDFTAFVPLDEGFDAPAKVLDIYMRKKPETIEYGQPRKEKINLNHIELGYRCPCTEFPLQRDLKMDEEDEAQNIRKKVQRDKVEEQRKKRRMEESLERKELKKSQRQAIETESDENQVSKMLSPVAQRRKKKFLEEAMKLKTEESDGKMDQQPMQRGEDDLVQFDEEEEEVSPMRSNRNREKEREARSQGTEEEDEEELHESGPMLNNAKIKNELDLAIEESGAELAMLEEKNLMLQKMVIELKEKKDLNIERNSEITMTEGKYFNMLNHVHQIRTELKSTQERYNMMAKELQQKLEEKQRSCMEIKNAFRGLTREVAKNAIYSKTDKTLSGKKLREWEEIEDDKNDELQSLRLENIRLRNQYAKNTRTLKKKEELADGLHLIDYEQLKIENQTLCEKIEERNEDLHKIRKSNTNVVQILTHLREKLQFEMYKNQDLDLVKKSLSKDVGSLRTSLSDVKKEKKKYQMQNDEIKQQTGIMTNQYLKRDYEAAQKSIKINKKLLRYYRIKFDYMTEIIQQYAKKNKWTKIVGSPKKC